MTYTNTMDWIVNEGEEDERTYSVKYNLSAGDQGTAPTLNDPGSPPSGPEAEIESVQYEGNEIDPKEWDAHMGKGESDRILEFIFDNPPEPEEREYTGEEDL